MKKLLLGVMYRSGDAVGGLVGLDITEQLHLGYSYDWSYGLRTFKYNQGSHEIVLRYDFISIVNNKYIPQDIFKFLLKHKKMKKLFIPIIVFIGISISATAQENPSNSLTQEIQIRIKCR